MFVCVCLKVNEQAVVDTINHHKVNSFDELKQHIRIGIVCGACREYSTKLIEKTIAGKVFMDTQESSKLQ